MSIGFQCPGCQRPYSVDSALAGKRVRCKQCGNEMRVPTPSRPASAAASPPRTKSKPPPVPADIYGFDDEPAGSMPMPAPMPPVAVMERERPSKKKRGRRSGDEGPWGVPIRWTAFMLFVFTSTWLRMIRDGKVDPSTLHVARVTVWLALVAMITSVVGAAASFFRGNRSAFRGESIWGQIAWGWTILGLTVSGLIAFSQAGESEPEPEPRAGMIQADVAAYERPIREMIQKIEESAASIDQVRPQGGAEPMERLWSNLDSAGFANDRVRVLPRPTSDQISLLKARFEGDFRAAFVRLRDAMRGAMKRFPADSPVTEYFQPVESELTAFLRKYDDSFSPGTDNDEWFVAVIGGASSGIGNHRNAPSLLSDNMPEIPKAMLEKAPLSSMPKAAPMLPPPNLPRGSAPPNFGPGPRPSPDLSLPGGPPRPPGIEFPRGPRPPGFPGSPPRPNFPRPSRFGPPEQ